MKNQTRPKYFSWVVLLALTIVPILSFADVSKNSTDNKIIVPLVTHQLFKKAETNNNWKVAFMTGKHGQVVFMNVSPRTNPKNEIGIETHNFDQIILIVEGNGKAVLNGQITIVKPGDMIFVPQGVSHNVVNLNKDEALKIVSIYSDTDIPANSIYKTKADEQHE